MECQNLKQILSELESASHFIKEEQIDALIDQILCANEIFIAGMGRSGFCARGFANRLLHLGFNVHFVGEPTTPPIKEGDLLIIGSGSGQTASLVAMAKKAKEKNANIATITTSPENTIGQMSKVYIQLPGSTRLLAQKQNKVDSLQPVGSLFEQLSCLTYDAMIMKLKKMTNQSNEDLIGRHANLE